MHNITLINFNNNNKKIWRQLYINSIDYISCVVTITIH
jgi:hypothetical protein